jgi:hypothetical protein
MRGHCLQAVVLAAMLGLAAPAGAPAVEMVSDGRFRVEWEATISRKGPRLEGYVYNLMLRSVEAVTLLVEEVDTAGASVRRSTVRVWGGVPAGDRAYFQVSRVTAGARHRLSVVDYELLPLWSGQ